MQRHGSPPETMPGRKFSMKRWSVAELSEEKAGELKAALSNFDKDGDGSITVHELEKVMNKMGRNPTKDELEEMFREVDADGDGNLDFKEFMAMMARKNDLQDNIDHAFQEFDKNDDGKISMEGLRVIFEILGEGRLTDEELNDMIRIADKGKGYNEHVAFYHS